MQYTRPFSYFIVWNLNLSNCETWLLVFLFPHLVLFHWKAVLDPKLTQKQCRIQHYLMRCFHVSIHLLFPINKVDVPTQGLPNVRLLFFYLNNPMFKSKICHSNWCDRGKHQTRVYILIQPERLNISTSWLFDCYTSALSKTTQNPKAKQDPIGCRKLIGHLFWNSSLPLVSVGY